MKIISYNVNGIRAAIKKGFVEWVAENDFDVICIQETKAQPEQVDVSALHDLGYHDYWHSAEKKGYSGLVIFSKVEPDNVVEGCGIEKYDREGRVLRVDFGDLTLINSYFPSGTSGDERQAFKMQYLDDIFDWTHDLLKERSKLILVGDYNIAHEEIDIHNPVSNKKNSGFLPEERAWMTKWFDNGFTDAFRHLNPEQTQYSWWTYRANARNNNKGWRIDYQSVTNNLKEGLVSSQQLTEVKHSDHCPVFLEINI
jgi:exodeoxyribonuclease-3